MQATVIKQGSFTIEYNESGTPKRKEFLNRKSAVESYGLMGYNEKIELICLRDPNGDVILGKPDLPKFARVA